MAYITTTTGTNSKNFLESAVGLVTKTMEFDGTGNKGIVTTEGSRKIVKAGTPYPKGDATATGIVFEDADVTDGPVAGSVMVAGRVLEGRIPSIGTAKDTLKGLGIVFVTGPETTR